MKIDYLYYLKMAFPPIDQLLKVGVKEEKFVENLYKHRVKRSDYIEELGTANLNFCG